MSYDDFITNLFCRVDDHLTKLSASSKHPQAKLFPSEVVTLAMLFSLKGVSNRAFYRWANHNLRHLFPNLPERTRLFRLFVVHQKWTDTFLAEPTLLGLVDTFGISLLHPRRAKRSANQIGRFGLSNRVWIVGCKICVILNKLGLVCGWDFNTANVYDTVFHPLIKQFEERMVVAGDHGFYSAAGTKGYGKRRRKEWAEPNPSNPNNLLVCRPGEWYARMMIETVFSMLTRECQFKRMWHRKWEYLRAHLAYTMALFNILVQWNGLPVDEQGKVHLHIAQFSL